MKKIIILCLLPLLLSAACSKDEALLGDADSIVGTWQLSERLVDPGDGSGSFQKVDSDRLIIFRANETIVSNGTLCFMDHEGRQLSEGVYDPELRTITGNDCDITRFGQSRYELTNGELIINYPCIEPCAEKFRKLTNDFE